jgi:hypothetical protein
MPIAQLRRLLGWLLIALGLWYAFHTLS